MLQNESLTFAILITIPFYLFFGALGVLYITMEKL